MKSLRYVILFFFLTTSLYHTQVTALPFFATAGTLLKFVAFPLCGTIFTTGLQRMRGISPIITALVAAQQYLQKCSTVLSTVSPAPLAMLGAGGMAVTLEGIHYCDNKARMDANKKAEQLESQKINTIDKDNQPPAISPAIK